MQKCLYCDFLSAPGTGSMYKAYVQSLINEIKAYGSIYSDRKIISIFAGGGTPSVLSSALTESIARAIKDAFDIQNTENGSEKEIEITIECNPGTLTEEKLGTYKRIGINRLSIGLQSANDEELKALGRIHTSEQFVQTFRMARDMGFDNINVDLMQAIPQQTLESWKHTLSETAALAPEHISAYSLIIEENTPFFDRLKNGDNLNIPSEDEEREIYYSTRDILKEFGYDRYEISNYSLPGRECRHNCGYWTRKNYLGLGLGSSSLIDNVRWKNVSDLNSYIEICDKYKNAPMELITELQKEKEALSVSEQMEEFMFLGLRMTRGIFKEDFTETFGKDYDSIYGDITKILRQRGFIETKECICQDPAGHPVTKMQVRLTDIGVDLSNRVLAEFLLE